MNLQEKPARTRRTPTSPSAGKPALPRPLPGEMLEWVCSHQGEPEVLRLHSRRIPWPDAHSVLVRNEMVSVETADTRRWAAPLSPGLDWLTRRVLGMAGPRKPVLGNMLVGRVVHAGTQARDWSHGDRIVACTGLAQGAHAQYSTLAADHCLVRLPLHAPSEDALSVAFGGMTALHFLQQARVGPGTRVLVIGATGSVGSACVQLATARAAFVTALARSDHLELAASLGAHRVQDYRLSPPEGFGADSFDVIIDTSGCTTPQQCVHTLAPRGVLVALAGGQLATMAGSHQGRRILCGSAAFTTAALQAVVELQRSGVLRPVIDSRWAFQDLPLAHARARSGHKTGAVLVHIPA